MDFDDLDEAPGGRLYDVTLYGASGFTGCVLLEHFDAMLSLPDAQPHKWAIAGRSVEKLKVLASKCENPPDILEVNDDESMLNMAEVSTVVVSAAGPFSQYGTPVVKACVNAKTHFIDVTGEVVWVRKMIDMFHEKAKEAGIFVVNCAGAMCALDDIAILAMQEKVGPMKRFKEWNLGAGILSGGTFLTGYKEYDGMAPIDFERVHLNPHGLVTLKPPPRVREADHDLHEAVQDDLFEGVWTFPGHPNHCAARILRRTKQLFDGSTEEKVDIGQNVVVQSVSATLDEKTAQRQAKGGQGPQDVQALFKFAATMEAMSNSAPKPGGGPPQATRDMCHTELWFVGEGENGEWAHGHYSGPEGYEVTALTSMTAALVILEEPELIKPKERGGVVTPGFALYGSTYVERLTGMKFATREQGRPFVWEVGTGMLEKDRIMKSVWESDAAGGVLADAQRRGVAKGWAPAELYTK